MYGIGVAATVLTLMGLELLSYIFKSLGMKSSMIIFSTNEKDIIKGNPGSERQRLPARLLPNGKSQSFKRRYFHCHPGYKGQEKYGRQPAATFHGRISGGNS